MLCVEFDWSTHVIIRSDSSDMLNHVRIIVLYADTRHHFLIRIAMQAWNDTSETDVDWDTSQYNIVTNRNNTDPAYAFVHAETAANTYEAPVANNVGYLPARSNSVTTNEYAAPTEQPEIATGPAYAYAAPQSGQGLSVYSDLATWQVPVEQGSMHQYEYALDAPGDIDAYVQLDEGGDGIQREAAPW